MCNSKSLYVLRALPAEFTRCQITFHWLLIVAFYSQFFLSFNLKKKKKKVIVEGSLSKLFLFYFHRLLLLYFVLQNNWTNSSVIVALVSQMR